MKITITPHDSGYFDVGVSSADGREPFLTIKGCKVRDGAKGRFVSCPATKLDSGKWYNHCWISNDFQASVLQAYDACKPPPVVIETIGTDEEVPF